MGIGFGLLRFTTVLSTALCAPSMVEVNAPATSERGMMVLLHGPGRDASSFGGCSPSSDKDGGLPTGLIAMARSALCSAFRLFFRCVSFHVFLVANLATCIALRRDAFTAILHLNETRVPGAGARAAASHTPNTGM